LGLNPGFAKGYSRRGAALHALKRYNDSVSAFEEGLLQFPSDAGLTAGLTSVKKEKENPYGINRPSAAPSGGSNPMAGLFGPDMMAKLALDPKTRPYLNDPEFMTKIQTLQRDPNQLTTMLGDPRIMEVFQVKIGASGMDMRSSEDMDTEDEPPVATPVPTKKEPEPEPEPEEDMTPEEKEIYQEKKAQEKKINEQKKASVEAKVKGNELYKAKQFEDALAAYDEAIALDPTNMTFLSNKAAVYFTTKQYDECIAVCAQAVEVGKENRAPFEDRAKALTRSAKAHQKKKDLAGAIEMCQQAQLESYDKATERLLKTLELEKRKSDNIAYQDDDLAEAAKQRGNTHFRNKVWGDAVKEYEEAVKRAPKNAPIRNNLSAALCKVMDFNGAKREIEKALDLDPKYVKAYARKGDIEVLMKENHKAMDSYRKGLELDPTNATCKEGLRKVTAMVNYGQANMTEEEKKERAEHGLADPEIQAILQDPVMRQVLNDMSENPSAGQKAMSDPGMRAKLEKLIAAGVLQTG
jgi:stress-induced-phosphoprotein 1